MTKSKDWHHPRSAIAQVYKNNDYGYVMHAGMKFMEFLFSSGIPVADLKGKHILDYGCGTGCIARFFALTGAHVVGYDPTPECIAEGLVIEKKLAPPTSLAPRLLTTDFEKVGKDFDIVICINVLPDLSRREHDQAIRNIISSLKEGGSCYLWVHKHTHLPLIESDKIRNLETNVVVVRGIRKNGRIDFYEK